MNTPAHLIVGMAAFGRPADGKTTAAALAGSFLPDASLYAMSLAALAMGYPAREIFGRLYFSDAWQQVFAVDNSFVLWGLGLGVALVARRAWAVALAGAALLHLVFDFLLHHHDARLHFWPLSDWKFVSPLSYWDPAHYGNILGPAEVALVTLLGIGLLLRFRSVAARLTILIVAALEITPFLVWRLMF